MPWKWLRKILAAHPFLARLLCQQPQASVPPEQFVPPKPPELAASSPDVRDPKPQPVPEMSFTLSAFVGQERLKKALREQISLSRLHSQPLPHILLSGPPENGKATLARALANEMKVDLDFVSAREMKKEIDLTAVGTSLRSGQLLVIEDVDLLRGPMLDLLIDLIENYRVALQVGTGPGARRHDIPIPNFTLVGTTCRLWQVDSRLRRWCALYDFCAYDAEEITEILASLAKRRGMNLTQGAARLLAEYCKGSTGNAAVLVKRISTHWRVSGDVAVDDARKMLALLSGGEGNSTSMTLADRLRSMGGIEFEQWVANLFREMGYGVEMTEVTGDHGIDLVVRKGPRVLAVQCKCWGDSVGEPVVRDFYGSILNARAQAGYIIATSSFTTQARAFAQDKPIQLIDLGVLLEIAAGRSSLPE